MCSKNINEDKLKSINNRSQIPNSFYKLVGMGNTFNISYLRGRRTYLYDTFIRRSKNDQ